MQRAKKLLILLLVFLFLLSFAPTALAGEIMRPQATIRLSDFGWLDTITLEYYLPNAYTLSTGNTLTIGNGQTLTVRDPNGKLTIEGTLIVEDGGRLIFESPASLLSSGGNLEIRDGGTVTIGAPSGSLSVGNACTLSIQPGGTLVNNYSLQLTTGSTFTNNGGIVKGSGYFTGLAVSWFTADANGGVFADGAGEQGFFSVDGTHTFDVSNLPAPTWPGTQNTFLGWFVEKEGGNALNGMFAVPASGKVYARWNIAVTGISLDKSSLALTPGAAEQLTATIAPANAAGQGVSWQSSDPGVAIVEANGSSATVRAVSPGNAVITASSMEGGYTATCNISVAIPAAAVKTMKTLYLKKGQSAALPYVVYPADATNKAVTFSSSKQAVATVSSSGKVVAKKKGTAVVTILAADGQPAKCTVVVAGAANPAQSLRLNKKGTLKLGAGKELQLTATPSPAKATGAVVKWTSSNKKAATVDAMGKVTALAKGKTTIKAAIGKKSASIVLQVK